MKKLAMDLIDDKYNKGVRQVSKKSLVEAFDVKSKRNFNDDNLVDYEIFSDKKLLEELRVKIVQNLIEENIPDDKSLEDYVNNEIDRILNKSRNIVIKIV